MMINITEIETDGDYVHFLIQSVTHTSRIIKSLTSNLAILDCNINNVTIWTLLQLNTNVVLYV